MVAGYVDEFLGSGVKVAALRLLCRQRRSFTGREIARRIGRSPASVHGALRELVASGVVESESHPPAVLYRIVEDNPWVSDGLMPLFASEASVQDRLDRDIVLAAGKAARSVVLFGSRAKGSSRPGSDLDVLIVLRSRDEADRVAGALGDVSLRYGLSIEPLFVAEEDLGQWARHAAALWEEVRSSGILLSGTPLHELMHHVGTAASQTG